MNPVDIVVVGISAGWSVLWAGLYFEWVKRYVDSPAARRRWGQ